jgi:hypothetical protein
VAWSLSKEIAAWTDQQCEFAHDSAINRITSDNAPFHNLLDPCLTKCVDCIHTRVWEQIRSGIIQELSLDTAEPWADAMVHSVIEAAQLHALEDAWVAYTTHLESLCLAAIVEAEQDFETFKCTTLHIEMEEHKEAAHLAAIASLPSTPKTSTCSSCKA